MDTHIKGLGTALVTPFRPDGDIDFDSLGRLIDYQIEGGVDFLCVLGTTAETATMSDDEKRQVIEYCISKIDRRVPILLGCSGNNTHALAKEISQYSKFDVDALLSVVPYYNKPTQDGIVKHYEYISGCTDKGIVMYNVPSRTGVNMTSETTLRIASDCKNVIAVKEASGNIRQVNEILKYRRSDFAVLSGDDFLAFPLMTLGADGVISVVANSEPHLFAKMVHSLQSRDMDTALGIHNSLLELYKLLFDDGNPAGIKAALNSKGMIDNVLRLPLVPVHAETYAKIKISEDLLARFGL